MAARLSCALRDLQGGVQAAAGPAGSPPQRQRGGGQPARLRMRVRNRGAYSLQFGSTPQEVELTASVLSMSMSLDGYIAGPNDDPSNPGGDGFDRLHEWYGDFRRPGGP